MWLLMTEGKVRQATRSLFTYYGTYWGPLVFQLWGIMYGKLGNEHKNCPRCTSLWESSAHSILQAALLERSHQLWKTSALSESLCWRLRPCSQPGFTKFNSPLSEGMNVRLTEHNEVSFFRWQSLWHAAAFTQKLNLISESQYVKQRLPFSLFFCWTRSLQSDKDGTSLGC